MRYGKQCSPDLSYKQTEQDAKTIFHAKTGSFERNQLLIHFRQNEGYLYRSVVFPIRGWRDYQLSVILCNFIVIDLYNISILFSFIPYLAIYRLSSCINY